MVRSDKLVTLEEFSTLKLDKSLVRDGLVFIWIEKKINHYIHLFMEAQGFSYVENFSWIMLDPSKIAGKFLLTNKRYFRN
jgi:hypothetical protein